MQYTSRAIALLAILVAALAASIYVAAEVQKTSANRSADQATAAEGLLIAQLDLETGLRGFLQFGDDRFLDPYRRGLEEFDAALTDARAADDASAEIAAAVERQAALSERWQRQAATAIVSRRAGDLPSLESALQRKAIVDDFRAENTQLLQAVEERRKSAAEHASILLLALVLGPSALFGGVAYLVVVRPARGRTVRDREADVWRQADDDFIQTLQAIDDESGAQRLLKRHIERDVADCEVVLLNRNNSDNRLEAVGELDQESDLVPKLENALPRTCLAVRLGREHREHQDADPLISCELCGQRGAALCVPSIVGGEVIGSVLVRSDEPLAELGRERVLSTVAQGAPVIANLRSLALAESRAATDSLTGLGNKRSCDETVRRMVAQSSRSGSPLAALAIDLDHFKAINDRSGHPAGDDALAVVGAILTERIRASDFAGRPGGEEFLVLLADAGADEALSVAEKLRRAIGEARVSALDRSVTASFGVAVLPDHANDADSLMRAADRALYAAKAAGRDRVKMAESKPGPPGDGGPMNVVPGRVAQATCKPVGPRPLVGHSETLQP